MAYSFKSKDYFNTILYTGNGGTQSVTGVGFQPDLVWNKRRTGANEHAWTDAVRGVTKSIFSSLNNAETTQSGGLTAFDSDGYSVGNSGEFNDNSESYVGWNWKANGQGSSNTAGTINTTYTSANTTAGFSIIKYNGNGSAGATIGHGLGVAPKLVIIKRTDTTSNWIFGSGALGFNKFLYLNNTDAATTNAGAFYDTAPSSSVITLGSWNDVNNASGTYVAYAWAEKIGFSKFGTYTGNQNADGPFSYTGFKPAFLILRATDSENWIMFDNKRDSYNVADDLILPNQNIAAFTAANYVDFYSNGFKIRTNAVGGNASGQEFVYMAFGEELVGTNNIPNTAR